MTDNPLFEEILPSTKANLNWPLCNLVPFPLVISLVSWEKRSTPTWLQPPVRSCREPGKWGCFSPSATWGSTALVLSLWFGIMSNMSLSQWDLQNHFKQLFVNPFGFLGPNICKSIPTSWEYMGQWLSDKSPVIQEGIKTLSFFKSIFLIKISWSKWVKQRFL